ncbi:MAG TPA: fatty acid desaturase, partial [Nevskiaceae bacterium]|nr:fatty acid desaturase [Nevskiaceae bacterium]
ATPEALPVGRDAPWFQQAKALVADLQERRPLLYWTDLLLSAGTAWALTFVYFTAPAWSALQIVAFLGASVLFFRAGTFIHELVHFQPGQLVWFGRAWNLLMGIPLLMPWVMYRNHVDHHSAKYYGTVDDGEYLPLARAPLIDMLKYLSQAPLLPLLSIVRFGLLGPLSLLHPRLRELVLTAASAAVINPHYRKRFPRRDERHLQIVEVLCFLYIAGIAFLVVRGVVTWHQLGLAYLLFAWTLSLNWVRTLAAHRYANEGEPRAYLDQLSDSLNITGQPWLTALMFPVGLRYHALHHLFPSLPYHNLGEAHRRLSERLPPDAPYHAAGCDSFFAAVAALWTASRSTAREDSAMRRWQRKPGAP